MRTSVVAATCAAMLAAMSLENLAVAENLVLNGGFEEIWPAPGEPFADWTVQWGFTTNLLPIWLPHSGELAAGFSAIYHADDTLLQTIPTTPGSQYQFDFWLINEPWEPPDNDFTVAWNGVAVLTLVNASGFPYTHYTYTLLATEAQTELRFVGANWSGTFALDDVSVTLIPEPSTLVLAGLGIFALAGFAQRRPYSLRG